MTAMTAVRQLDSENPWPGLESFGESAHDYFFGRDREAESLLNHVRDASVTVLYGRSGLGKTSLLRAGLFPALREENFLPVYVRLELQEGSKALSLQLHQSVYDSIRASVPDALLPTEDESLWEYLHRKDFELWSAQNYPLTPVIVIDQFEELFTLGERVPDLVRDFMNDLGDLAENRIPADVAERIDNDEGEADRFQLRSHNYKLLITLREDFLPHLEEWSQLIPTLKRSRVRLLPLRQDKAFDAVYKPATNLMSAGLAERVVRIVAGEDLGRSRDVALTNGDRSDGRGTSSVEPALLSLFCRELNEERKKRGQSEFDEQLVEDAKSDILSNYYSSCVRDLPPGVAEFIESELITEKGFRDSYAREDAVPSRLTGDELGQLISSRLLRLEEYHGAQRIELTHDVLTGVVREHRDRRRAEEEKAAVAARAEQERQEFAEAAERHAVELDRERRASRRFRKLSAALALVCVAAIVLAVVAVRNGHRAADARNDANAAFRDATAQKLLGASQLMLAGLQQGGSDDVLGMQELLAAITIPSKYRGAQDPLLRTLNEERDQLKVIDLKDAMSSAAFSPDGTRIVAGSTDKTVRLWDAATGKPIVQPMRGHDQWVTKVAFSADGAQIASASLDGTVRLWDASTGKPTGEPMQSALGPVQAVAFSPDGTKIASGGLGMIQLWDASTQKQINTMSAGDLFTLIWDVSFSPDGTRLVSGGDDKTVRLWDVATGSPIGQPLRGHDERVTGVAFSPDATRVASASGDKTVRLWDAATGRPVGQPLRHNNAVQSVAFSPDGSRIASGGADKTIRLWDVSTGRETGALDGHRSPVETVAFSRDGRQLVSAGDDKTVRVWDATSWQPMIGHEDAVQGAEFFDDGRRIASSSKDDTVRWWDTATGRPIGPPLRVGDADVESVFPFGEDRLMSVGSDRTVLRMWDAHTGKPIGEPIHLPEDILGARRISWVYQTDRILATTDLNSVQLFNAKTMQPTGAPIVHDHMVAAANFSPDGQMLATGETEGTSGTKVQLFDAHTQKPIGKPLSADGIVASFSFSRDHKVLAVGSIDGTESALQLWDTGTSQPVGNPMKIDSAGATEFSPDGRILASSGTDGAIRLWNVADQTQRGAPLTGHSGRVTDLDFSPDGTKLMSTSDDRTLRLWPIQVPSPEALCAKLTHNMSREQWEQVVATEIEYIPVCPGLPEAKDAG
jgi:WD40 repeat protein